MHYKHGQTAKIMYENQTANYLQKQIETASPAQRVVMLYDGAIKFYLKAKQAIEQKDIEARFNANKRATDIIVHLLGTLNLERGGDVAQRLYTIYMFIMKRQMDIDLKNDATAVDEIVGYLKTLRKSWEEIATKGADRAQAEANGEATEDPKSDNGGGDNIRREAVA